MMTMHFRIRAAAAILATALLTSGSFASAPNPGGGTIVTGTLGRSSLTEATAALLRRVHADLGSRPAIVQVARNDREHSLALLFTATRNGTPITGVGIVTAAPGAQTSGAALYDTAARFHTTVDPMMRRLREMTDPSTAHAPPPADPAEPLSTRPFTDGTGSIGVPGDWTLRAADGGSAAANGPDGAQIAYNMHFGAVDPSNPRAQMLMHTLAGQAMHNVVLPYISDPGRAWVAIYSALARANGLTPDIRVKSTQTSGATSTITGTLGSGPKAITFLTYAFVLPPDPNGHWTLSDSHIFLKTSNVPRQGATALAVLGSVRINQGALAGQQQAIRNMFERTFETEIANDQAEDRVRQEGTDEALASDRAAQEGMHRQAVSMENYSLDRAVVVDQRTGIHSTIDSGFADDLVQYNPNYSKVPAQNLLRGIDY